MLLVSIATSALMPRASLALSSPGAAAMRARPTMLADAAQLGSALLANGAAAQDFTPLLLGQAGVCGSMLVGGYGLEKFGDVPEPKEVGAEDGAVDIYRDSPLRYCGYLNEVGEAFRPLIPVEIVYLSRGRMRTPKRATGRLPVKLLGTFVQAPWLASVVFPSFCINRLVVILVSLQAQAYCPEALQGAGGYPDEKHVP
ncbi:hypothetical protein EMIHUDRAFT_249897 [Emiliania huxleyi CCMP1516]|uniref:Mitochondrial fission process protein 1 n=2 Tax=Emiliania huxleyi TaxID=2903 RepID=A0A0D3I5B4_EMIH1|nr:hypothetical protein EMIHUDRAFT_249897 [Emiliania huxleyi CCMP1516]EOD06449.1 hypothetical protein EMIHUDRAFT_249897 [Emiliania huxleyi CCMP1516]|eukprot:XP_005758878.1 hypothetical protein EMIHUDRAFT_249897 [Emiliania huxleyi CCMP1516]